MNDTSDGEFIAWLFRGAAAITVTAFGFMFKTITDHRNEDLVERTKIWDEIRKMQADRVRVEDITSLQRSLDRVVDELVALRGHYQSLVGSVSLIEGKISSWEGKDAGTSRR